MRIVQLVGTGLLLATISGSGIARAEHKHPKHQKEKPEEKPSEKSSEKSSEKVTETMTDRCSGEVAFPPTYDGKPTDKGTVILKRGKGESKEWSGWAEMKRGLGDDGHVRWWCHSTTGNFFDPGTWVVNIDPEGAIACLVAVGGTIATDGAAAPTAASCLKALKIGSSAFEGWTPERSRCSDHSKEFRARLGPDRLLTTECLGK